MPHSCPIESKHLTNHRRPFQVKFITNSILSIICVFVGLIWWIKWISSHHHQWTFERIYKLVNSNFAKSYPRLVNGGEVQHFPPKWNILRSGNISLFYILLPYQKIGSFQILLICLFSHLIFAPIEGAPLPNHNFHHQRVNGDKLNRPGVIMPPYDLGFHGQTPIENHRKPVRNEDFYQSDQTPGSNWNYDQLAANQHGMNLDPTNNNQRQFYPHMRPNIQKPFAMNLQSQMPVAPNDMRTAYNWDIRQPLINPTYQNQIPNYPMYADQPNQVGQFYPPWSNPQGLPYPPPPPPPPPNYVQWQPPHGSPSRFQRQEPGLLANSGSPSYQPINYQLGYGRNPWSNYPPETQQQWYVRPEDEIPSYPSQNRPVVGQENFAGHPSNYRQITEDEVKKRIDEYHAKDLYKLPPLETSTIIDIESHRPGKSDHNPEVNGISLHGDQAHGNILTRFIKMVSNWPHVTAQDLFKEMDLNDDGLIQFDELRNFLLLHELLNH